MKWQNILDLFFGSGKKNSSQNQRIWWFLGIAALGALLMLLSQGRPQPAQNQTAITGTSVNNTQDPVSTSSLQSTLSASSSSAATEEEIAKNLGAMLSRIAGAGHVEVEVHLADTGQTDYASNVTTEKKTDTQRDGSGSSQVTTDTSENDQLVMTQGENGNNVPVVRQREAPQIAGVLVVAQGAGDPSVREMLTEAVATALDLPYYRILVLPGEGSENQ